jgi:arginyl-tRNA synthetase
MKEQILKQLEATLNQLKADGVLPETVAPRLNLDRTKDKTHGDFSSNVAMMLAKPAQKNPRALAQLICDAWPQSEAIDKVEIAGPGFINFFVSDNALAQNLEQMWQQPHFNRAPTTAQTIVIDYSSPNLAKEMHVGHLRSSIIGDAMVRVLTFLGHKVIKQNHVGDWGTQFGMLLAYMEELRANNEVQEDQALSDLEHFYRAAKVRFDESSEFADRARELVVALQSGDAYCKKLWREFNQVSLSHCHDVYKKLGVLLTQADVRGESCYNAELPKVRDALKAQGLLQEDQGAQCVFLDEFKNKQGDALPIIIQKAGGGYPYAATDLAAINYRVHTLKADRLIYVVDMRQELHFRQIFSLAKKAQMAHADTTLEHLGFGTMNGQDGKPFKTRSGDTVKLVDLIHEAQERALALVTSKNPDFDAESLTHIAQVVGISAVKYADLSKHRTSDYIFSFEHMLSFEGNTAPYLLYALTRINNILNKVDLSLVPETGLRLSHDHEVELGNALLQFNEVIDRVASKGTPHSLCSYLFDLAGRFSRFYESCPVLNLEDETLKQSRLQLLRLTAKVLQQGLDLLGLETLERM